MTAIFPSEPALPTVATRLRRVLNAIGHVG